MRSNAYAPSFIADFNRRLIHEYVEVVEYRNGAVEIQAAGRVLPCRKYDRITQIDQGAKVENKRMSAALEVARFVQGAA